MHKCKFKYGFNHEMLHLLGTPYTLLCASSGVYSNLFLSRFSLVIPDKILRKLFDCLLAYVDIYQQNLCDEIDYFYNTLKVEIEYSNKLSPNYFLHFLTKTIMICYSFYDNDENINQVARQVILKYQSFLDTKYVDCEGLKHILFSLIYVLRVKKDLIDPIKNNANKTIEFLMEIESNNDVEFNLTRQTFILNLVMICELPIDDAIKKILNEIKFIKNMEVLPILADCFIYIFKIVGEEISPLLKKFSSVVFSSEKYILDLMDKETLQFYSRLMKSIKPDELIVYTNLNESSIHQIELNMQEFPA